MTGVMRRGNWVTDMDREETTWGHKEKTRQGEGPQKEPVLQTPKCWTFSLQTEKISFHCLNHSVCGSLLWQPQKTHTAQKEEE